MQCRVLMVPLLLIISTLAVANRLEDALNQQYKDRIYTLRWPMTAESQQYDSSGNPVNLSPIGSWTIYGRIEIKKIRLQPNRIVVEAKRIGMARNPETGAFGPLKLKNKVALEIAISQPVESAEQFRTILERIFAFTKEEFVAGLPDLWRNYARRFLKSYAADGNIIEFGISEATLKVRNAPPKNAIELEPLNAQHQVKAPMPRETPFPPYTQAASAVGLNGTVSLGVTLDEAGQVTDVQLLWPVGMGLDESAASTVKTWLFTPAIKDGKPIKIDLRLELSFWH